LFALALPVTSSTARGVAGQIPESIGTARG
jgi:hypothetical protein